jgi:hypothetical protein
MASSSMSSAFDLITVACFAVLVGAFFQFTDRQTRTLVHFAIAGVVFAVANQVGNAGSTLLAATLIVAGAGYAAMVART